MEAYATMVRRRIIDVAAKVWCSPVQGIDARYSAAWSLGEEALGQGR